PPARTPEAFALSVTTSVVVLFSFGAEGRHAQGCRLLRLEFVPVWAGHSDALGLAGITCAGRSQVAHDLYGDVLHGRVPLGTEVGRQLQDARLENPVPPLRTCRH